MAERDSDGEPAPPRLFRSVEMPPSAGGRIFLHAMPGRREPLQQCWKEMSDTGIDVLVSLTGLDEIRAVSPQLAAAIVQGRIPCEHVTFDISDFGVPEHEDDYLRFVRELAERIQAGASVLIHCQAGIGRTGTLAVNLLNALGRPLDEALLAVRKAEAGPMNDAQSRLVSRIADRLKGEPDVE